MARWCWHTQRVALVAAAAALVAACISPKRVQPLDEAVRGYNDGIRWLRFAVASQHVPVPDRDDFLDHRDRLSEDLRITDYEVIRVRSDPSGYRARVHLKFTWHLDSRGVVHETHTVQSWRRASARWYLVEERHLRGEPMPGVAPADPPDDDDRDRGRGRYDEDDPGDARGHAEDDPGAADSLHRKAK